MRVMRWLAFSNTKMRSWDTIPTVTEMQSHASKEAVWLTEAIAPFVSDHPDASLNSARVAEASILNRSLSKVSTFEILVPRVDNVGELARDMSRIAGLA